MKNKLLASVLHVGTKNGKLVIEIGLHTLQWAFERSPQNNPYDDASGDFKPVMKVTDAQKFADEIVRELCDEQEDGTTPVHLLFDKAFESAVGNGCEGIEEV